LAQEAKDRLREIVEGFFFRFRRLRTEDGKHIGRLLVKSPPGLGKTREGIKWAIHYQAEQEGKDGTRLSLGDFNEAGVPAQTSIFVPRHQLAEELREVIERTFLERGELIRVPILRGRENGGEEGNAPCRRWREPASWRARGSRSIPISASGSQTAFRPSAPISRGASTSRPGKPPIAHSHLGLQWGATAAERFYQDGDEDDGGERERHFNPKQANIIVCDEDPTASLVEEAKLSPEDIRGLGDDGLGDKILAGLLHPGGLLSHLREQGISVDQLREAAEGARTAERSRGQISSPATGDGEVSQAAQSAPRLVRLSRVLERLAEEVACGREGPACSLLADGNGLIAQGRRAWVFEDQRLLLLDGTANPEILRQFVPHIHAPEIRVHRNARIIQVQDLTFFRHSLVERAPAGEDGARWRPTVRLAAVAQFIERVAKDEGRTLVVTNKRVRCALSGENPSGRLPVKGDLPAPTSPISGISAARITSRTTTWW
jgi:hypothetical protein